MKIYAVRDRLIDYFLQPFVGPDDKNVLAAIANDVNKLEATSAIAQAPHHFEIWELGEVDQEGHITPKLNFLADCSSLIRRGIRTGDDEGPGRPGPRTAVTRGQEPPAGRGAPPYANRAAISNAAPATPLASADSHPALGGGN